MQSSGSVIGGWLVAAACLLACSAANAAPSFPELTGRVVDEAGMLSAATERSVAAASDAHENATSNQVVVVTVPDLQGYSIEEYGYQLGRHWGIGQKDQNNGVLLIVAKAERKVRIEVGYGLEGELTDAIASDIIHAVITPQFKRANFDAGVSNGTQAIIQALGGEYQPRRTQDQNDDDDWDWPILLFIFFFFVMPRILGRGSFFWWLFGSSVASGSRGRSSGGGFGGGGFSGGGGSFGGGGASGGW